MSYPQEKQPDKHNIVDSPPVVPYIASSQQDHTSHSKEEYELGNLRAHGNDAADVAGEERIVRQGNGQADGRFAVRAIPTSYKLMAFSMIIFFNTSSSFSESTLSPLKGIFRAELGVTSKSSLLTDTAPRSHVVQTHNMGPSPPLRASQTPFCLYLAVCRSITGAPPMPPSSAPSSSL